jgi:hypothetical protein
MKGILEGAIKQVDILKHLAKLGYSFCSLICAPILNASGLEEIQYDWKDIPSVDGISGKIDLFT